MTSVGGQWCVMRAENLHLQRSAWAAFGKAIRAGAITRQPCVVCGETRSVGHHEDYAQPIAVIWLCHFHHSLRHCGHSVAEMQSWRAAA